MGWEGEAVRSPVPIQVTLNPGDVLLRRARPLHAGLCVGSPDLVGWRTVEVNGEPFARFVGLETKTPEGRLRDAQAAFQRAATAAGAICEVVRSVEDAVRALK